MRTNLGPTNIWVTPSKHGGFCHVRIHCCIAGFPRGDAAQRAALIFRSDPAKAMQAAVDICKERYPNHIGHSANLSQANA